MISSSLASPTPSKGGDTEERGDVETETKFQGRLQGHLALKAVKGDKTLLELAEQFSMHPTQITEWKQQFLAWNADVFGGSKPTSDTPDL